MHRFYVSKKRQHSQRLIESLQLIGNANTMTYVTRRSDAWSSVLLNILGI